MVADVIKIRQGTMGKYYEFKRSWFISGPLSSPNIVHILLKEQGDKVDRITLPSPEDAPDYILPLELHARGERWDCLVTSRELIAYQVLYKTLGFDCMLPTLAIVEKRQSEGTWNWMVTTLYQQMGWGH